MFARIVSRLADWTPDSLLLLCDQSVSAPKGAQCYRLESPLDAAALVGALFGNHLSGIHLASIPVDLSGLTPDIRRAFLDSVQATVFQWGTSVIDPACGIGNLIANGGKLLPSPRVLGPITNRPALAIGAGPSTSAMMDEIRAAAPGMLVVAADAALGALTAEGIRVHACAPLERLNSTAAKLKGVDTEGVIFCGSPFAPPAAVNAFSEHALFLTPDPIYAWFAGETGSHAPGPTSGTAAVAVALELTTGPVYLIGHDLCDGHMQGAQVSANLADPFTHQRPAYDGTMRSTKLPWLRAKNDLEGMGVTGRLVNPAGRAGHGLVLSGIPCDPLPSFAGMLPGMPIQPIMPEPGAGERATAFRDRVQHLEADLRQAADLAARATCLEQVSAEIVCPERSRDCFIYLMRGVYAQASLERRLGRSAPAVMAQVSQGIGNAVAAVAEALGQEVARAA